MTKGLLLFPHPYGFHAPSLAYVENLRSLGIDMHYGGVKLQSSSDIPPYAHHYYGEASGREFAKYSAELVDTLRPDFVHVFHHRGAGLTRFYSKTRGTKWIMEVRTVHVENKNQQLSGLSSLKDRLTWLETLSYDLVIANTETIRRRMLPARRPVVLIPTGASWDHVNPPNPAKLRAEVRSKLQLPDDAAVVIYAGRMSESRGLERMIAGFAEAHAMFPNSHLLMIGGTVDRSPADDPSSQKLMQQAAELGIEKYVHFTGRLPFAEVPSYYAAADIGVSYMPPGTPHETQWPNKLMEMMMAGLIAVTNDTVGSREVFLHDDAVIISGDEATDIADAIQRALGLLAPEKASQREQLIAKARARGKELDWKVIIRDYLLPTYVTAGILTDNP